MFYLSFLTQLNVPLDGLANQVGCNHLSHPQYCTWGSCWCDGCPCFRGSARRWGHLMSWPAWDETSLLHPPSMMPQMLSLSRPSLKAGAVPLHYFQCKWELFNCWLCIPGHGEHKLTGVCLWVTSCSTMASLQWSFIYTLSWLWQGEFSAGFLWFIASELYLLIHKIPKRSYRNASFLPLSPPRGLCAKKRLGIGWQVISWFAAVPDLLSYQSPPLWELFLLEWQQTYSCCGFIFSFFLQVQNCQVLNLISCKSYQWILTFVIQLGDDVTSGFPILWKC